MKACGDSPPLVLLHGWGMHAGVWSGVIDRLDWAGEVICPQWPGHGGNVQQAGAAEPAMWLSCARPEIPQGAVWVGWSLGGLLAFSDAAYAYEPLGILAVASTPRFRRAPDWPHGMTAEGLDDFKGRLARHPGQLLRRFRSLLVLGEEDARRAQCAERLEALARPVDPLALAQGLGLLDGFDACETLGRAPCPVRFLLGVNDPLVPVSLSDWLQARGWGCQCVEAGHLLPLCEPDRVAGEIRRFAQALEGVTGENK